MRLDCVCTANGSEVVENSNKDVTSNRIPNEGYEAHPYPGLLVKTTGNSMKKTLSIVIPCYNEEQVLPRAIQRIESAISELQKTVDQAERTAMPRASDEELQIDYEIIFVNDGSNDHSFDILRSHQQKNTHIRIINFARNFGHQIAATAGIDASIGDAVVLMDCDMQDPPETITKMFLLWLHGYDVIYATRTRRQGETAFKKITAKIFYRILASLSDTFIPVDTGDFRLMDRRVVEALSAMPERDRFIRGMVSWVGFKQISLPYERAERTAGNSKYPIARMISFALNGLLSFSTKPLKLASIMGFISSLLSLVGLCYALYSKFVLNNTISGWTSLMIAVLFIGGIQLFCIGVLGEYVGRIFKHAQNRPLYIVEGYYGYTNKDRPRFTRSPTGNTE